MAFPALIPILTALGTASASAANKSKANTGNALTLANSAFTGQRAGGFDNTSDAGKLLLQGLAGSFKASQGAKADAAAAAQAQELNARANRNLDLKEQFLLSQRNKQLGLGGGTIFTQLGNGLDFNNLG